MVESAETPIVIKRIKKGGHAHHGGSWKVAYADFVTAMMAFFLLLWLLNVTTPDQKKGIADYFTPTIGIKGGKGIGVRGGRSPMSRGTAKNDLTVPGLVVGQVQQGPIAKDPNDAKHPDESSEATATGSKDKPGGQNAPSRQDSLDSEAFKLAGEEVRQALSEDPDLKQFNNNVEVHETPEGLKIELIDDEKKSMFVAGGAELSADGKKVLDGMANIVAKTPNAITIFGHTDVGGPLMNPKYTNWELSTDRANSARRALITTQIEPERVFKVVGLADKDLLVKSEPASPRNRRVSILLMRGVYFQSDRNAGAKEMMSTPEVKLNGAETPTAPAAAVSAPAKVGQ